MAGTPQHCTLRDPSSNLPKRKRGVTCFCIVPDVWSNFRIKYRASRAKSGPNRWAGYHSEVPHPHLLGLHLIYKWRRYRLSHSGPQDSGSTGKREGNLCENICAAFLRFDACRCPQLYTFQCTVSCVMSDGTPPALTVDTANCHDCSGSGFRRPAPLSSGAASRGCVVYGEPAGALERCVGLMMTGSLLFVFRTMEFTFYLVLRTSEKIILHHHWI